MPTRRETAAASRKGPVTGRVISTLIVLFLIMDGSMKLARIEPVLKSFDQLGYPQAVAVPIGVIVLACAVLYAVPRTSILGAILTTGLLGGAIASQWRIGAPAFSHTLFGAYIGLLAWGGLYLRDGRLRAMLPFRLPDSESGDANMAQTHSRDGTLIAYERRGDGPPLIIVDGAFCSRSFGPSPGMAKVLSRDFTVYSYDRRGRGGSGDAKTYAVEREFEDLAAIVKEAGGSADVVGFSSGAALALRAAVHGIGIRRVAAYEPPYMFEDLPRHAGHGAELRRLIAEDRRGDAVKYFMRSMIGLPIFALIMMRLIPGLWRKLKAVAHTLPYDAAVMGDFSLPARQLAAVSVPTILIDGEKSEARLRRSVEEVAAAVPGARRHSLKGQTHNVKPEALSPVLVEFFRS